MKNKFVILLLISVYWAIFVGGVSRTPEETITMSEAPEETTLVATEQTVETTAPITEATIPEATEIYTGPIATEPPVTPPMTTEPFTEPESTGDGLISLGTFKLTAYCACYKCCGKYALNRPVDANGNEIIYGASGSRLTAGISIAVDPRVIPYGTQVVFDNHTYTAHDTGGGIKGNRIDVYFDNHQDAWNFGVQYAEVFVYG